MEKQFIIQDIKSKHVMLDLHGCPEGLLNDAWEIDKIMRPAIAATHATILDCMVTPFSPQGVTAVYVLAESHASIHCWPEFGYAAVDFYTCGDCDPEAALPLIVHGTKASRAAGLMVSRGGGQLSTRSVNFKSFREIAPGVVIGSPAA